MTCRSMSADSDDVRRSLDVLDKVLSEFDDIDLLSGSDQSPHSPDTPPPDNEADENDPPPVDRSLKPRISPPTLPKKRRIKQNLHDCSSENLNDVTEESHNSVQAVNSSDTNTQVSQKSGYSEASSHEYQEISSDLLGLRPDGSLGLRPQNRLSSSANEKLPSRYRLSRGNSSHEPRSMKKYGIESPLRKSRSGDVVRLADEQGRERKNGRRLVPRRTRSSDRIVDRHVESKVNRRDSGALDPRVLDPKFDPRFTDPRFYDPRFANLRIFDDQFVDPKLVDPLLLDPKFDPHLMDPLFIDTRLMGPPFHIEDPRRYPLDASLNFPHLMTLPAGVPGPFSLPPLDPVEYPNTIPRHNEFNPIQDHLSPNMLLNPPYVYPMAEQLQGFNPHIRGLNPHLKDYNSTPVPLGVGHPQEFLINYPLDMPMVYPMDIHLADIPPRERLDFIGSAGIPGHRGVRPLDPRMRGGSKHPAYRQWLPPSPEEAKRTIQRLVRNKTIGCADRGYDRAEEQNSAVHQRYAKKPRNQSRRATSTSNTDSSGRSSPLSEEPRHPAEVQLRNYPESQGQRLLGRRGGGSSCHVNKLGGFRVGEAVRKDDEREIDFGKKEVASLPHFPSGGKDSGFDESPLIEDPTSASVQSSGMGGAHGTGGGGFVVSGVFNDSSKIYIPAPPSPIPDYDNDIDTEGEDLDIPQEPFYVSSRKRKDTTKEDSKSSSSSNRDSISDDSLQESRNCNANDDSRASKTTNSLQTLLEEFQMTLPPVGFEESTYSDDSLEEESSVVSPSRPSTMDFRPQRPQSMESLVSMEGSTTSFDYMGDPHSKCPSTSRSKRPLKERSSSLDSTRYERNSEFSKHGKLHKNPKNPISLAKSVSQSVPSESLGNDGSKRTGNNEKTEINDNSSPSIEPPSSDLPKCNEERGVKFEAIKHLIKEGLIEGLDDSPPDFKPPPPSAKLKASDSSASEDRADSGLGSTASTSNKADESGGSDHLSERSSTTPKKLSESSSSGVLSQKRSSSPPPLPPPRDSSMNNGRGPTSKPPTAHPLSRNQSWLYRNKRMAPQPNAQALHNASARPQSVGLTDAPTNKSSALMKNKKKEKVTHVDNIYPQVKSIDEITNGNLASQYASPHDQQKEHLDNSEYIENKKNMDIRRGVNANQAFIFEDHGSVSSHGSKSGRFFSRLTESMKSSSRCNSPLANKSSNKNRDKKINPAVRGSTKFHGDFIRDPSKAHQNVIKPLFSLSEFQSNTSSVVSLTRDGSGRFRSIEDLAEAAAEERRGLDPNGENDINQKRKKHSTLPPNLTPADMQEQAKSIRGGNGEARNKEEAEGSKFKFNIFRGFWRRNKYSFDKA